jgi:hypothetical protein
MSDTIQTEIQHGPGQEVPKCGAIALVWPHFGGAFSLGVTRWPPGAVQTL